ncbi:hypothetical protein [Micromonospora aurantiaca (nom. illeg.)]|nr:hypothetical protein [Micromonospora aurantiaca]
MIEPQQETCGLRRAAVDGRGVQQPVPRQQRQQIGTLRRSDARLTEFPMS